MGWQFGYNCKQYLPTLRKCRVLIDSRRRRFDLVEGKWLGARDLLVYTEYSPEELVGLVGRGQLGVKRRKNGLLLFRVPASWAWDDCPLSDAGGECQFFEEHDGQKIACLKELETIRAQHPNTASIPSDDVVRWVDERFSHVLPGECTESS